LAVRTGRFSSLPISPVSFTDTVRRIEREKGIKVVRFDLAEPLFPPLKEAIEETVKAVESGYVHYPPPRGIPELVEEILSYFRRTRGLEYDADEVIVTPGAKFSVYSAFASLLSPGDEVLLITPYWVSFKAIPEMFGARCFEVRMKKPFGLDEEALKDAVKGKKVLVLNSPNNPTGWVASEEELKLVRDLALDEDLIVLSDEVDWAYVYEGEHRSIATLPDMKDRTLLIDSFSKVFGMTGWRVGFSAGPKWLIDDMLMVQQHSVSGPTTFSQKACAEILKDAERYAERMVGLCRENRDYLVERLSNYLDCPKPPGAFYLFPDASRLGLGGDELSKSLLEYGVAVSPGRLFGEGFENNFRICYAMPKDEVVKGVKRIEEFFRTL